jgi:peptidyl-prolyl cis-trans isomerase C
MTLRILAIAAAAVLAFPVAAQQEAAKPAAKSAKPPAKAAPAGPTATVNGTPIPRARFDYLLDQQLQRGAPDNDRTHEAVREDLINREVVAQAATRAGFAKKPAVQTQMDIARQEVLVGSYLSDYLKSHPVTDADVQKEYDRIREQTGKSEYKASHILVETEDQAKQLIAELQKGAKFADLAKKSSKDEGTRGLGGDLDWKVPSTFEKPFGDALMKLEKGQFTTTPVHTRYGYHVILLEDVRAVQFPTVAQVQPQLRQRLMRQKIEEFVRELRAKAKVQ